VYSESCGGWVPCSTILLLVRVKRSRPGIGWTLIPKQNGHCFEGFEIIMKWQDFFSGVGVGRRNDTGGAIQTRFRRGGNCRISFTTSTGFFSDFKFLIHIHSISAVSGTGPFLLQYITEDLRCFIISLSPSHLSYFSVFHTTFASTSRVRAGQDWSQGSSLYYGYTQVGRCRSGIYLYLGHFAGSTSRMDQQHIF